MRIDGLGSVSAGYDGGTMRTHPFRFRGKALTVNFATSAAGSLRMEFQDEQGRPIEGFTLADAVPQIGNEISRTVTWKHGSDVSSLSGRVVRLRCDLSDAALHSLRFVP